MANTTYLLHLSQEEKRIWRVHAVHNYNNNLARFIRDTINRELGIIPQKMRTYTPQGDQDKPLFGRPSKTLEWTEEHDMARSKKKSQRNAAKRALDRGAIDQEEYDKEMTEIDG